MPPLNGYAATHQNLRTPGPTPLPPEVREALSRDMVNHRGPEFASVLHDCKEGLQWAFQTRNDVLILTASGTGGLESIVANTLSPGQKVLAVSIGNFGDRFAEIARQFGAQVVDVKFPWGQAAEPSAVAQRLSADLEIETVYVTHNETSTGVMNPIKEIAGAVRTARPDALLAVDGISSIGSVPIEPEEWGIDVAVAGSQKGWMIPPGLTFVMVGPRGWERQKAAKMPRAYLDWLAHKKYLDRDSTPFTPAVGLIFGLQAALRLMRAEGLEAIFARHERLARRTREGLAEAGTQLFADPRHASWTVTTALPPEGVNADDLIRAVRERHDVVLAEGQDAYKGRLFRVGHLGYVSEADVDAAVQAVQAELARVGAAPAPAAR